MNLLTRTALRCALVLGMGLPTMGKAMAVAAA